MRERLAAFEYFPTLFGVQRILQGSGFRVEGLGFRVEGLGLFLKTSEAKN